EDLVNYVQMLVNTQRLDGLILLCVQLPADVLDLLRGASFPVCFVENEYEDFDCVVVHNLQGGQKAAQFLCEKGCKKPGFIGEKSMLEYAVNATEERLRGFKFYCADNGIVIPENHIWLGEFSEGSLDEGITKFLEQEDLPDGIFCSSDVIAARLIRIALTKGISVPKQIRVIGFDNIDIAEYIGLTSVNQNLEESGRMAARLILMRIKDRERGSVVMKVPLSVIERETTGR
ncbi:MAG: substrate-binding domain-containing protein, partial [Treponema sp.]|nr:substrate-binding domain-containing protein [Treponema sp.]